MNKIIVIFMEQKMSPQQVKACRETYKNQGYEIALFAYFDDRYDYGSNAACDWLEQYRAEKFAFHMSENVEDYEKK